jgi:hypothetical protein
VAQSMSQEDFKDAALNENFSRLTIDPAHILRRNLKWESPDHGIADGAYFKKVLLLLQIQIIILTFKVQWRFHF